MARVLEHAVAAALGARLEAFQEHAALDVDRLHLQRVDIGAIVVLGVGDRRLEQLLHDAGALLRRVGEDAHRLVDRLAADQIGDQAALLRRHARAAEDGFGLRYFFPPGAGAAAAGAAAAGAAAPGALAPGGPRRSPPTASSVRLPTAEWLLKMRVRANSPSLCPTMFSVTYTGTCCLPLCTAIVRPMKSGTIVERRDQVLIGRLSLPPRALSTLAIRWWSTKGPFLTERAIAAFPYIRRLISLAGRGRSSPASACSCASCSPWSARPRAIRGAAPRPCGLRRRRGDGRSGSSPRRAPSGARRASACGRPCRSTRGYVRHCRPRRWSRGNRYAPCGSRPSEA